MSGLHNINFYNSKHIAVVLIKYVSIFSLYDAPKEKFILFMCSIVFKIYIVLNIYLFHVSRERMQILYQLLNISEIVMKLNSQKSLITQTMIFYDEMKTILFLPIKIN